VAVAKNTNHVTVPSPEKLAGPSASAADFDDDADAEDDDADGEPDGTELFAPSDSSCALPV
jgi:hypothetical protein